MLEYTPPQEQTPLQSRHPPGADTPLHSAYWEIWATSGRYTSYWNVYLFKDIFADQARLVEDNFDYSTKVLIDVWFKLLSSRMSFQLEDEFLDTSKP